MGRKAVKTKASGENKQPAERAAFVPVWVAVVTGIVTITVALLSSPVLQKWLETDPTPSPTLNLSASPTSSSLPTLTAIPSATAVEILFPNDTPSAEISPTSTMALVQPEATTTPTSSAAAIMYVKITANQTTGKAPLTVKFDARASYVQAPDGTIFECRRGACRYRWSISLGGQAIALPDPSEGTLSFKFQEKGTYVISVYICHGSESPTCGNGYTLVIVN